MEFGEVIRNQQEPFFTSIRVVALRNRNFSFYIATGFV